MEATIVVGNTLAQVEVSIPPLAVHCTESGAKDGDGSITLNGEVGILGGAGKASAVPGEVSYNAYLLVLYGMVQIGVDHTILITNVVVQVHLGVDPLAILSSKTTTEEVTILETKLLGCSEEVAGHSDVTKCSL